MTTLFIVILLQHYHKCVNAYAYTVLTMHSLNSYVTWA